MDVGKALLNLQPEPVPGYKFQVFINNIRLGFSRVTNIEESIETEPFQEGGVNDRVYSLRRPISAERTLVFERGLADRSLVTDLLTLRFAVGQRIPQDILILVGGRSGAIATLYQVHGAVVKKWSVNDLDAMNSQVLIERFEVAYETLENHQIAGKLLGGALSALGVSVF